MHTLDGLDTAPAEELDQVLKHFFVDVRKQDKEKYTSKYLVTMRFGIQKHFMKTRNLDIINDKRLKKSSDSFKAVLVNLKSEGKGSVKHKEIITDEDLERLHSSGTLSLSTQASLQNKVWFDYMLYFCNRGRENLREIKKSDFEIKTDSSGRKFVQQAFKRGTKNHRGDDLMDDDSNGGIMMALPGDPLCPVVSFEKYLAKLNPKLKSFWQRPKAADKVNETFSVWYDNISVGNNTLGKKMKEISIQSKLSKVYTNHCIRATCISILDEAGVSDRHICGISGHKSIESLKSYKSRLSEKKKRDVSGYLRQKLACTDENINLPANFAVENVSVDDINTDPVITEFLSPSQEDRYLASIRENDLMNTESEGIIPNFADVQDNREQHKSNIEQPVTFAPHTVNNDKSNLRQPFTFAPQTMKSDQILHYPSAAGMTLFSYGTVHFNYHYH